jgi:hypothetical protein
VRLRKVALSLRSSPTAFALAFAILVAAAAACVEREYATTVRRDSAAVTIVELPPGRVSRRSDWTVSPEPQVQIGDRAGDSPASFISISGLARLASGLIVVLDRGASELRIFDSLGAFVKKAGRAGTGPGEFQYPTLVRAPAYDSIVILDRGAVTIVASDGEIHLLPRLKVAVGQSLGMLANGRMLTRTVTVYGSSADNPHISRSPVALVLVDIVSGRKDTVEMDTLRGVVSPSANGVRRSRAVPLDLAVSAAVGTSSYVLTRGNAPEILEYGDSGDLRRILRILGPPRRLTGRQFDSAVEEQVAGALDVAGTRRLYGEIERPELYPIWQSLILDSEGLIWAERFRGTESAPVEWNIFDPDGDAFGTVAIAGRLEVRQVGAGFVLGVWRDDDGVEHVRVHQLDRTGRGSGRAVR